MASKLLQEGDSPTPSLVLLPQLRQSRRGSIASLASTVGPDKEAIAQVLDQIHSSASQSDSLTTFNEYTSPPSSSSGPDSKGIAGELQGGITGLYNRFRASVGNVKDALNPSVDDRTQNPATREVPWAQTPAAHQDSKSLDEVKEQEGSSRRLSIAKHRARESRASLDRGLYLKPPPTPLKPFSTLMEHDLDESIKDVSVIEQLDGEDVIRRRSTQIAQNDGQETELRKHDERKPTSPRAAQGTPSPEAHGKVAVETVSVSSDDFSHPHDQREHIDLPIKPLDIASNGQTDDVFTSRPVDQEVSATIQKERKYQHLEIPLRRSLAPPIVSRSASPRPTLGRGSSTETNVDSLISIPRHQSPPKPARISSVDKHASIASQLQAYAKAGAPRDLRTMNVFSQVKNKVLNKEYWMKDENARDCFSCGDAFSTFRRKHHCRTCGQIFDAKCTSVVSGQHFGQNSTLRVCKPCEGIIKGDEDSSDFSDDESVSIPGIRPRHGSTGASDALASPFPASSPAITGAPTMSIPAARRAGEKAGRKPTILEFGSERGLARPSSSRSLKSAYGSKSHGLGHRRHNSRNHFPRMFNPLSEDNAPFHQDVPNKQPPNRLGTFHDDNIIDPDLAPYLSDDQSSGDEQMSIMAAFNGGETTTSIEDRHAWESGTATSRKTRSKLGEKSLSSVTFARRDTDTHSLSSAKPLNLTKPSRRRNFSITSATHLRPSPRNFRTGASGISSSSSLRESASAAALYNPPPSSNPSAGSRMMRSSSMRGAAAPNIELNSASLQHVQKLLRQLLIDNEVPYVASWEKALLPILLRATDDVNPDVQNGDDIDIRHYIKLKKVPGGRPGDTSYVSGLVFTKNLALKRMPRSIPQPNILILTFPLEYARHQQQFMSLEPVIRQEREFLQNLVNRIAALRPQLLLVERHVSGLALEFLEDAHIATAYNVKASVLEAVSRCCQTRIISSVDKLAMKPAQAGKCANFYLKTYVNQGRRKTYMFLSGCAKELGCTIVLRGADTLVLKKIKSITEFMTYVVYNLKLETCLMKDEFAQIPSDVDLGSLSPSFYTSRMFEEGDSKAGDARADTNGRTPVDGEMLLEEDQSTSLQGACKIGLPDEDSVPDDVPMPTFYTDMVEEHRTKILSASPFVKFMQPYLLMRARGQERRLAYLKRLRDQDTIETLTADDKVKNEKFDLIQPEMVHKRVPNASQKVREVLYAVHDAEYDKALHIYQTQSRQWESYIAGNINLFDPYAHQNIAVLYSVVCTATTVPCSGPDMVALSFYNEHETDEDFEADCTLGQYVEDLCLGARTVCASNGCEKKMSEHHRQYVHGEAQLSVFVEHYPCKMRGFQDTILMWSSCRKCGKETDVLQMSENTWKYSFGKYLELSFWSSDLKAKADTCPHDIHRDHLRYFGFKNEAVRIHYDPINLLEIAVPRARITWKVDNDLRFRNEVFSRIEERSNKFMVSVKSRIKSISADRVLPEKIELCKREVDRLAKKAAEDHSSLTYALRDEYMGSKHYETVPLNKVIRSLQERVIEWDNIFADFDQNFFPSEKDIRRLATLQLKKIFLERDDSTVSTTSDISPTPTDIVESTHADGEAPTLIPQTRSMSSEKAHVMLASVLERDALTNSEAEEKHNIPSLEEVSVALERASSQGDAEGSDVQQHGPVIVTERAENAQQDTNASTLSEQQVSPASRSPAFQEHIMPTENPATGHSEEVAGKVPPTIERTQTIRPTASFLHSSSIPRPAESTHGANLRAHAPPSLSRTYSHIPVTRNGESLVANPQVHIVDGPLEESAYKDKAKEPPLISGPQVTKAADRKISDRLHLSALKPSGISAHSMIPRSITSRRKDSRVSHLAKHFEQLSREFEKERIKERRQRAAKNRYTHSHPMRASRPIVQIYRNVHEAVEEKEPSDEDLLSSDPLTIEHEQHPSTITVMAEKQVSVTPGEGFHAEQTTAENTEADELTIDESGATSDVEGGIAHSDDEQYSIDDIQVPGTTDEHHALSPEESQLDLKIDLPKHEKSSLMKMLTNFWAERSASGWQPLEYPLRANEHIFADSDIIVREDEPSSLIAFSLGSADYQGKLSSILENSPPSVEKIDECKSQDPVLSPADQVQTEESLLRPTGTHLKYQFLEGSAKMLCKVFYAEQFDAVRRKCGVNSRIVESLSRCMKWDSKGGKTKSVFLKTLDDRFVLKSLSPVETQAFLRFAPAYFRIMSESLFHELPSVIAKMLGFYQIIIKNPTTGVDFNWYLLVMENLFYDRSPTRIFDLKGSMRNRRIQSTGEQNEVLLDENMVEFIYESPLFAREHSKKLLRASVWNDTLFLSRQNVMDYSLMIAIDEDRKELVVGIIDCIRTYTWDKKLESWIKDRGKNRPTVTSPKEYKSRFREAMGRYVLQAPNCWHQFKGQNVEAKTMRHDNPGEEKESHVLGL